MRPRKQAACHATKPHYAKGLCYSCYKKRSADKISLFKDHLRSEIEKRLGWLTHKGGFDYEGGQETAFSEVLELLEEIKSKLT